MKKMTDVNNIDKVLKAYIQAENPKGREPVLEAMEYSLLAPGKRVRPMLCLAFAKLAGGTEDPMPFACAVEMIHCYSLIHDDLPCMDNDDLRRGRPTCHKVYGEAMALLAGDGLLTMAFHTMLNSGVDSQKAIKAAGILSRCAGVGGMIGGQCIDLNGQGRTLSLEELEAMDMGKTVALISAACLMGVVVGGGDQVQLKAAEEYAKGVGMAFQIRDDILDLVGDAGALGKNINMDAAMEKCNYVSILGVEKAQTLVKEYTSAAINALKAFPGDTSWLRDFALNMQERKS